MRLDFCGKLLQEKSYLNITNQEYTYIIPSQTIVTLCTVSSTIRALRARARCYVCGIPSQQQGNVGWLEVTQHPGNQGPRLLTRLPPPPHSRPPPVLPSLITRQPLATEVVGIWAYCTLLAMGNLINMDFLHTLGHVSLCVCTHRTT